MSGGASIDATDDLVVSRIGRIGRIRLNRPKALNALTLDMVRVFARALDDFAADPDIVAALVTGEGDRGLCGGGDIRALYEQRNSDQEYYKQFWREEYQLDARIAAFAKPYIVVMDGVVMGGGVGVSAHGNRRIVTERTRLAMPETGIGFIPDAGGTWLLSRGGGAGIYMALAGVAVSASDAIHVRLADMAVQSRDLARLESGLSLARNLGEIGDLLDALRWSPPQGELQSNEALLDDVMSRETVTDIVAALRKSRSDFANAAACEIERRSPIAVMVTHALLKRARSADRLEDCLLSEFRAACALLNSHDLYEGVRAAIIEKDKRPRWSPPTLAAVDGFAVAAILKGSDDRMPELRT